MVNFFKNVQVAAAENFYIPQTKSFIILDVLPGRLYRVGGNRRVIASAQHSSFPRNVAAEASRWQHCSIMNGPNFKSQTSRSGNERVTARPMANPIIKKN